MLGCFFNPKQPFSTFREKIAVSIDIASAVGLSSISKHTLSNTFHSSMHAIGTLGNRLPWMSGAGVAFSIGFVLVAVKMAHQGRFSTAAALSSVATHASSRPSEISHSLPFEEILSQWVEEGPQEERSSRMRVARKIRRCYSSQEEDFFVFNQAITSLPDVFGHFTHLKDFCVTSTQLLYVPDSIGKLSKLKALTL